MGFDNDCILNIQSLAGEYFCPVCHLLVYPNEALQAPCTHLYCKPCLTYVVSTTHACPYDGYRVTEADCKPLLESNKALADTIEKIQVHCLYYRTGCTWQGPLSDCMSHCSTCSFGESPVLCNRCGVQIVHRQVQEHAQSCPGVQSQVQQPSTVQDGTSTGAVADQTQTGAQAVLPASQAQTSQASTSLVSGQDNQTVSSAGQPQAAQAAMPTAEQWYQQQQQYQQQYQQYYQQYPGYDPYQQNYPYYYQYQQGAQQYPQQPSQGYPPQAYGLAQTQVSAQAQQQVQPHAQAQTQVSAQAQTQVPAQAQAQVPAQAQTQPQQQPQAPSRIAQPPMQTNVQPSANVQSQVQSVGQAQPQMQAQGQAQPQMQAYNQSQPLPQTQPYAQPQHIPQQQTPVPQYQQTHPQAQSYPPSQTQTQHYPYTQPQPHSQPTMQVPAVQPPQQNQPMNPNPQFQTQNAVTGYQSYPQPQPHPQAQVGVAHPLHATGAQPQPQYPGQMQGKFPSQPSQMYPSQPYSNVVAQQQPAISSAQVQPPSGPPSQQLPVYPHSQQPGYPLQLRPGVQAAQQAAPQQFGQQPPFPGHGPFTQPQPPMTAQLHTQGPPQMLQHSQQNYAPGYAAQPNIAQNYAARPVTTQGAVSQPHLQTAGAGQVRPPQLNQSYPMRTDSQLSAASEHNAGHPQQYSRPTGGEKLHDQNDPNKESGAGAQGNENKLKSENALDGNVNENESKLPDTGSNLSGSDNQELKQRMKGETSEGASELSHGNNNAKGGADAHKDARNKAEVQDLKHTAKSAGGAAAPVPNMPHPHLLPQVHGSNSFPSVDQGRNQRQSMHHGPSAQYRPGSMSMPQSTPQLLNSQQPGLGHLPGQLRPQGPGQQAAPRPPFNAADNPHTTIPKHPHGPTPHEIASGGNMGPASSGPFARPGNMGYHQGNMPPYQAGQPHNLPGDPFVGIGGRERADAEQRPPYPMESEKFQVHRPGYFDGRKLDSHPHGSIERAPYGPAHPGAMKFGGPSARDSVSAPGMRDERVKMFPEERLKPFPHRDFEDDARKFPRPPHFEAGPSSKYGTHFPSSGPLDHGPHMFGGDGMPRPFDKASHGLDHDSGLKRDSGVGSGPSRFMPPFHLNDAGERSRAPGFPDDDMGRGDFHRPDFPGPAPGLGFGRPQMDGFPPRSPGRDFPGFPSRTFGAFGDDVGNESRPFDGSRPHNFPAELFGKSMHENRFPIPPNHLQRGELGDHLGGGHRNPDMLPNHLRREHIGPRNMLMGEGTAFGLSGGHSRMGEPPLAGNFPRHLPFGESFGGEKPGRPLIGEQGFRGGSGFNRYARDGGFFPEEMEPFDNPRKRKPGSIMCRICKVECGTVEGLDLHSQSREHQRKARDMVLSIKQSNKKKQKISKDQASIEGRDGGRSKNSSFQGRGNKR